MRATLYTDGSGLATAGPGGIAYVGHVHGVEVRGSLPLRRATNQMAEILAAAYALDQIPPTEFVRVVSDSQYVVRGMNEWLPKWVANGWKTGKNRPVMNQDHWRRLLKAVASHGRVEFVWTRGHAGTWANEEADRLAAIARKFAQEQWPDEPEPEPAEDAQMGLVV